MIAIIPKESLHSAATILYESILILKTFVLVSKPPNNIFFLIAVIDWKNAGIVLLFDKGITFKVKSVIRILFFLLLLIILGQGGSF